MLLSLFAAAGASHTVIGTFETEHEPWPLLQRGSNLTHTQLPSCPWKGDPWGRVSSTSWKLRPAKCELRVRRVTDQWLRHILHLLESIICNRTLCKPCSSSATSSALDAGTPGGWALACTMQEVRPDDQRVPSGFEI